MFSYKYDVNPRICRYIHVFIFVSVAILCYCKRSDSVSPDFETQSYVLSPTGLQQHNRQQNVVSYFFFKIAEHFLNSNYSRSLRRKEFIILCSQSVFLQYTLLPLVGKLWVSCCLMTSGLLVAHPHILIIKRLNQYHQR